MLPVLRRRTVVAVNRDTMLEQHYSVKELAERWGVSYDFVFDRIRDEPDIVRARGMKGKRATLRVPESVALRVYWGMRSA